jgi:hypothetical protein
MSENAAKKTELVKRKPRASDARVNENKNFVQRRAPITIGTGSFFNVPQEILRSDPDHSYSFIPYHSGGRELLEEYEEAVYVDGFVPVKRSSHPLLKRNAVETPFSRKEEDDLVKVGGQILMKRPIEYKIEQDKVQDMHIRAQEAIKDMHRSDNMGVTRVINDTRTFGPMQNMPRISD